MKQSYSILMLIPELGYGGAEKSFLRLSHLLSEYHTVQIVVFKRHYAKGNYTKCEEDLTLPIIILDHEVDTGRFNRWKNRWEKLNALKKDNDITISFLTGANILNASVFSKTITVISMRGSRRYDPHFSFSKRMLYELFVDPLTFMLSDKIISVSDGLTNELRRYALGTIKQKIQTIEVFVNAKELIACSNNLIEKEIESLSGKPLIVGAGRLSDEKGFQYLIPIFAEVCKRVTGAKLILIGDGPQYQNLVDLCIKLKLSYTKDKHKYLESSVIFLGYKKDPLRYFRVAKVFVLSSLTEGFPNGIIEALASGTPVVANDCPWGPRSVLCDEPKDIKNAYHTTTDTEVDYGVLMPRIDSKNFENIWIDKLSTILMKTEINIESTKLGRQRVQELDISNVGKKWLKLIDDFNI